MLHGAFEPVADHGYNNVFYYPEEGLDRFIGAVAARCRIHFQHRVLRIDSSTRVVWFADGQSVPYDRMISTIPLDAMVRICGISCGSPPDPATAVLVVNIAARKGANCPPYHWVYVPRSRSGIHRVGFYSNVERSFLPAQFRDRDDVVSIYAEKSDRGECKPTPAELKSAVAAIVDELKDWGFITDVLVVDPTYTDPAYTWSWQGSQWAKEAIARLAERGIQQIGRYGAWRFQGILASFEEGLAAGKAARCDFEQPERNERRY